jgi:hypothetical protein
LESTNEALTGDNRFRSSNKVPITDVSPEMLSLAALKMYKNHLSNMKKYQKRNPEKMREKSKRYMVKLKNDETKYSKYLEKRKETHTSIIKMC